MAIKKINLSEGIKSQILKEKYSDKLMQITENDVRSIHRVGYSDIFTIKSLVSLAKTAVVIKEVVEDGEYNTSPEFVDLNSIKNGSSAKRKSRNQVLDFLNLEHLEESNYKVVKLQRGPKYLFAFLDKDGVVDYYLYLLAPLSKKGNK